MRCPCYLACKVGRVVGWLDGHASVALTFYLLVCGKSFFCLTLTSVCYACRGHQPLSNTTPHVVETTIQTTKYPQCYPRCCAVVSTTVASETNKLLPAGGRSCPALSRYRSPNHPCALKHATIRHLLVVAPAFHAGRIRWHGAFFLCSKYPTLT